jgi:hypothetical protein
VSKKQKAKYAGGNPKCHEGEKTYRTGGGEKNMRFVI